MAQSDRMILDQLIALRDRQRQMWGGGRKVIRGADLPLEMNAFAPTRWYMHPFQTDACLQNLIVSVQELPAGHRSGRLRYQGGSIIYVLEGSGHTVIDGVRHHWKQADLLNIPMPTNGVDLAHVSEGPDTARLLTVDLNLVHTLGVDRGSGFEVIDVGGPIGQWPLPPHTATPTTPAAFADVSDSVRNRAAFAERQQTGKVVVDPEDRTWTQYPQGRSFRYLHPTQYTDTALSDWIVFIHDIKAHSGSHIHQGGVVIYALEGEGSSVVEGQRWDWDAGDLLLLPFKPGGVEHQHFNRREGAGCKFLAFIFAPFMDLVSSPYIQREGSPEFQAQAGRNQP